MKVSLPLALLFLFAVACGGASGGEEAPVDPGSAAPPPAPPPGPVSCGGLATFEDGLSALSETRGPLPKCRQPCGQSLKRSRRSRSRDFSTWTSDAVAVCSERAAERGEPCGTDESEREADT